MKLFKYGLLVMVATAVALATGCVERRVVYVPAYQSPPGYTAQTIVTNGQTAAASPSDTVPPSTNTAATQAPPAPQVEVIPVAPGPDYYWVPGHWNWSNGGWIWLGGRWTIRPWHGAIWVHGGWARGRGGWRWRGGHWR